MRVTATNSSSLLVIFLVSSPFATSFSEPELCLYCFVPYPQQGQCSVCDTVSTEMSGGWLAKVTEQAKQVFSGSSDYSKTESKDSPTSASSTLASEPGDFQAASTHAFKDVHSNRFTGQNSITFSPESYIFHSHNACSVLHKLLPIGDDAACMISPFRGMLISSLIRQGRSKLWIVLPEGTKHVTTLPVFVSTSIDSHTETEMLQYLALQRTAESTLVNMPWTVSPQIVS